MNLRNKIKSILQYYNNVGKPDCKKLKSLLEEIQLNASKEDFDENDWKEVKKLKDIYDKNCQGYVTAQVSNIYEDI